MLSKKIIFFLVYIKMLEITRKNCYKCDLETIITNGSQYFWINLRILKLKPNITGEIFLTSMEIQQL